MSLRQIFPLGLRRATWVLFVIIFLPFCVYLLQLRYRIILQPLNDGHLTQKDLQEDPVHDRHLSQKDLQEDHVNDRHSSQNDLQADPVHDRHSSQKDLQAEPVNGGYSSQKDLQEDPVKDRHSSQKDLQADPVNGGPRMEVKVSLQSLGVMSSRSADGWSQVNCNTRRKLRAVTVPTRIGNLTFYVFDSAKADKSATARALRGYLFEGKEIQKFLSLWSHLPLIDVGANLGLVTLQAAMQGKQVVAMEPIPENAVRLCRSAIDFGHGSLIHVIRNAVTSSEGDVVLDQPQSKSTLFHVASSSKASDKAVHVFGLHLDRLLEVINFTSAVLKIDVESHEGHVIAGSERLFQLVNIPMVWMEWQHVKKKKDFGGAFIMEFMGRHGYHPHHLMTGHKLDPNNYLQWPFTVLWRKTNT